MARECKGKGKRCNFWDECKNHAGCSDLVPYKLTVWPLDPSDAATSWAGNLLRSGRYPPSLHTGFPSSDGFFCSKVPRQLLEGNQIGNVQLINHSFSNELFIIMIGIIFVSFPISGTERDRRIWACSRSDCKDKKKMAVDGGPSCQSLGSSSPVPQADADDFCSRAEVRTNEIRRLSEYLPTLNFYYKIWYNYPFFYSLISHKLYLIMGKKSFLLILLVAVRTRPDILDGMRKLWFILTTCPQQC